jgi:hypothetical protein
MKSVVFSLLIIAGCSQIMKPQTNQQRAVMDILYDNNLAVQERLSELEKTEADSFEDSVQLIVATTLLEWAMGDTVLQYKRSFQDMSFYERCEKDSLNSFSINFVGFRFFILDGNTDFVEQLSLRILSDQHWFDAERVRKAKGQNFVFPLEVEEKGKE